MRRYARIILQFWKATLIQQMEYRTSFFLGMLANSIDFVFGLIQYALFFAVADKVADWEMNQMLAFYGVFMSVFSLHFIFLYPNLDAINQLVNTGQLDLVLTKPFSGQFLLSFRRISFEEVGSFLASQILLWVLVISGRIEFSGINLISFLLAMACSMSLIYAGFLFLLGLGIWLEKLENMADLLWSMFGLCRYPADIFPPWLKRFFWTIIPIAFVTTVPARTLVYGESPGVLCGGLLLTVIFLSCSTLFWRWSLAGYTSAGG